jgi:hypothetical protein
VRDPDLHRFQRSGGKLLLWQGEADWSIPTITSIAYYQAVVKAMGGLQATQQREVLRAAERWSLRRQRPRHL